MSDLIKRIRERFTYVDLGEVARLHINERPLSEFTDKRSQDNWNSRCYNIDLGLLADVLVLVLPETNDVVLSLIYAWVYGEFPKKHLYLVDGNPANLCLSNITDTLLNAQGTELRRDVDGWVMGIPAPGGKFVEVTFNAKAEAIAAHASASLACRRAARALDIPEGAVPYCAEARAGVKSARGRKRRHIVAVGVRT